MGRKFTIVALVLPLATIALGIVRAELFLSEARSYVFEVEGFDPRDLLRGHYLQFRLRTEVTGVLEPCDATRERCCVCFEGAEGAMIREVQSVTCTTARATCGASLEESYLREAQRFYVPEARAQALEQRLRDAMLERRAQAVIAIDRAGHAVVKELRVDGVRLEDVD